MGAALTHVVVVRHPSWSLPKIVGPIDLDDAIKWREEFTGLEVPDITADVVCAAEPDRVIIEIEIEGMLHGGLG
jgi:hypothetical protein